MLSNKKKNEKLCFVLIFEKRTIDSTLKRKTKADSKYAISYADIIQRTCEKVMLEQENGSTSQNIPPFFNLYTKNVE